MRKWNRNLVFLFSLIYMISGVSSVAFASGDTPEINGNIVSIISQSEDGCYKIKSSLKNVKSDDGTIGKMIYSAELLAAPSGINRLIIGINRENSAKTDFKFSSSSKAQGLLESTGSYTLSEIQSMVTEGIVHVRDSSFLSCSASGIFFDTGENGGGLNNNSVQYPQTLFSCEFPINPNYDSQYWRKGFENSLTISVDFMIGTTTKSHVVSSVFSLPPAGEDSPSGGSNGLTIENNFTAPDTSYFDDAGITVTPSNNDLSFTVACNKACVVAVANSDGTYTRLTGTAEDNAYKFTANSADDQIVVAVKGDATEDGEVDISDVLAIVDGYTGESLTSLQNLVADVDGSNSVDVTDVLAIVDAYVGSGLNW